MACEGVKPVVAIYSTFLQRGYDQLIHDVALQNLPVVFALDRAGLVGADGATHAGAYDIAFVRCIPNMAMACPADERECRQLLSTAFAQQQPVCVRYPRGAGAGIAPLASLEGLVFGKGEVRRTASKPARAADSANTNAHPVAGAGAEPQGTDGQTAQLVQPAPRIAMLAFGTLLYPALQAAETLDATVVNMRWAKPLDLELLLDVASSHDALVTLGGLHCRRRGQRGAGSPGCRTAAAPGAAAGPARHLHRARRPGAAAGAAGPGRCGHRALGAPAFSGQQRSLKAPNPRQPRAIPGAGLARTGGCCALCVRWAGCLPGASAPPRSSHAASTGRCRAGVSAFGQRGETPCALGCPHFYNAQLLH